MNDILKLDAIGQAELIRKKEITPLELVDLSISAIEKENPKLNAVITPMFEQARDLAKSELPNGAFKGVPMLLKDGIASCKDARFTSGSRLFKKNIGRYDSKLVKRYKRAGFIILGKTNMPEFGLLPTTEPAAFGATHNPWDLSKTPGGSSGGSAAAVAARLVAVAHGNDGGGSIRIPASCCGLFGLKPTRGRNPLGPLSSLISGLVEEHVLTRSVRDSAAILDITGQVDDYGFYRAPAQKMPYLQQLKMPVRKLKIGFTTAKLNGGEVHQDCVIATQKAVELCRSLGHEVVEMPFKMPISGKELGKLFGGLWAVGATTQLSVYQRVTNSEPPKELVEPLSYALYETAKKMSSIDYELLRLRMHQVARKTLKFFKDVDVWLSPCLGMPPIDLGSFAQDANNPMKPMKMAAEFSPMTALFNISGQPAASVPIHWNANNLPIGVQLVSKFGDEAMIFQLAQQMENEVNWQMNLPVL